MINMRVRVTGITVQSNPVPGAVAPGGISVPVPQDVFMVQLQIEGQGGVPLQLPLSSIGDLVPGEYYNLSLNKEGTRE